MVELCVLKVNSNIIFDQNCKVTFDGNTAQYGGAAYVTHHSNSLFTGRSSVTFRNNTASKHGGAMYLHSAWNVMDKFFINMDSHLVFEGMSSIIFNSNRATLTGGAILSKTIPEDPLQEILHKSTIDINNTISNKDSINLVFAGASKVTFTNNKGVNGGAI